MLFEDAEASARVDRLLESEGLSRETPLIGINPGAFYGSSKQWSLQRFGTVARRLSEATSGAVIVAGSQAEHSAAQKICDSVGHPAHNLSGRVPLVDLVSLIRRMTIFVTNDSGPMHIAAAAKARTVAIFGSTDWVKTSPWSENAIVVRHETVCAPCMLRHCPIDHRCMERIFASDVIEAIRKRWPEII
jgi:heptosyltransferase-2